MIYLLFFTLQLSKVAIKEYNRGRMYLSDLAKRERIPVFDSISGAVECATSKCLKLKMAHQKSFPWLLQFSNLGSVCVSSKHVWLIREDTTTSSKMLMSVWSDRNACMVYKQYGHSLLLLTKLFIKLTCSHVVYNSCLFPMSAKPF